MRKIWFTLIALVIVVSMFLVACQPAATVESPAPAEEEAAPVEEEVAPTEEEAAPAGSTRIVWADTDNYYTFDPFVSSSQWVQILVVFDQLWVLNPDFTDYVGVLAESWETSEDGLTITIKLREDATFTDGSPVDAEAIKWDIDYYRDPELGSAFGGWMVDVVKDVTVIDPYTLEISLNSPYAPFFYWMAQMSFPSAKAYQELGPEAFANAPVGSGPFIVVENVPDSHVLYKKNPDYKWFPSFLDNRGPAKVDELLIKFGLEDQVIFAQLQTGEVDVAQIAPTNLAQARSNPDIEIFETIQAGQRYLGFNTEIAPYNDPAFRKALAFAIDRDELVQVGYEGEAIPVWSPLSPAIFGWSEEFEKEAMESEPFDPDLAIEMLTEAGYVDADGDGFIDDKDGNAMPLRLAYSDSVINKLVSETLQGQLSDIGLDISLEALEGQVVMNQTMEGTHSMIYWSYGLSDATILTYLFKSNRIGGSNRTRFNSPEIDALLDIMESEMDPEVRAEKVVDVMRLVLQERPMISLLAEKRYYGYRSDKFSGVLFDKSGYPYFGDATPIE